MRQHVVYQDDQTLDDDDDRRDGENGVRDTSLFRHHLLILYKQSSTADSSALFPTHQFLILFFLIFILPLALGLRVCVYWLLSF